MPAASGDPSRRIARAPREWTELDTATGFERCVRATLRELYGYVALLCGHDRREAERLVAGVYRSLFAAVQAGHVDRVTLGALRSAGRRVWLDAHREELAAIDEVSRAPVSTIAELSPLERGVLVLSHVNGMSVDRCATELGRSERDVAVLGAHAVRRLRGTDDTSGAWLRAYLGPTVTPAGGLVDRIVRHLGDTARPAGPTTTAQSGSTDRPAPDAPMVVDGTDAPSPDEPSRDAPSPDAPTVVDDAPGEPPPTELPATDLPTTELAVVDRPTVEIPTLGRDAARPVGDAPAGDSPSDDTIVIAAALPAGLPARDDAARDGADVDVARRRPTWVVVVGAVLVVALVVALVWLAVRGDAGDTVESAPSTTTPTTTPTTAPTTTLTTAAVATSSTPTSTISSTTVAAGAVELGFDPACAERSGGEPSVVEWSETLGALATEPALIVTTPESVDVLADPDRAPSRPEAVVRPDGAIVAVRSAAGHRPSQTLVSRIGFDGAVVWTRCLPGDVDVASAPDAGVELAARTLGDDGSWTALAVADGATGEQLDGALSAILDSPDATPAAGEGPTLGFSYASAERRTVPAGLDDGEVLWTAPDVVLPTTDGAFRAVQVDDVALVQTCAAAEGVVDCAGGELRGYDLASGEVLWRRPGAHAVPVSGDGVALVGDGSAWELVDVTSGATVAGQRWGDPDTFAVDPTDGVSSVARVGGAVIVTRPGEVTIWLPVDATTGAIPDATEVPLP